MTALHAGDKLDHYQIENLVARSGMASIYKATDALDGRTVAIKVPHPEMEADPLLFDRFKREQEIGEKLDHPGVMKVFGGEKRSRIYMVMEWVPGHLLRDDLRGQRHGEGLRSARIHSFPGSGASRSEAREHHGGRQRYGQADRFRNRRA